MIRLSRLDPALQRAAATMWAEMVDQAGPSVVDIFDRTLPKSSDDRILLEQDLTKAAMADGNPALSMTELRAGLQHHIDNPCRDFCAVPPEIFRPEEMQITEYSDAATLDPQDPFGASRVGEQVSLRSQDGSVEVRLLKLPPGPGGEYWYAAIDHASSMGPNDELVAHPQPFDEMGERELIRMLDALKSDGRLASPGQRLVDDFLASAEKHLDHAGIPAHTRLLQSFVDKYLANGDLSDAARVTATMTGLPDPATRLAAWRSLVDLYGQIGNGEERDRAQKMVDLLS